MPKKPIIAFEHSRDEARDAWFYRARGKFVGSEICYEFLEAARDNIAAGVPNVIIDLSGITMLNSTGIGIIASLYNTTKEKGGKVCVVGASPASQRPLAATHLWDLLEKCEGPDDLPDSFA